MSEAIKIPIHTCEKTPMNEVFVGLHDMKTCPFCKGALKERIEKHLHTVTSADFNVIVDDLRPRHRTMDEQRILAKALRDSTREILTTPFVENGWVKEVEK